MLGFDVDTKTLVQAAKPLSIANYLIGRRGMLTSPAPEAYGFVCSDSHLALPDLESFFGPGHTNAPSILIGSKAGDLIVAANQPVNARHIKSSG